MRTPEQQQCKNDCTIKKEHNDTRLYEKHHP